MTRVLSGIQPTGNLHLGNYLGALKNWIPLQDQHECLFCIVNLHAITLPQDPAQLAKHTLEAAATYLAAGVDPDKSSIFVQSTVPAHNQLAWLLSCLTPMGWLNRMTQFKEKAGKQKESAGLGLYAYPVLQAADILIYKATHVPIGEDQKQHLELTRDIALLFNRTYKEDYFPAPEPLIMEAGARVMSLRDGSSKMSKSDASDYSRIHLYDDDDLIAQKIRKAKTDAEPLPMTKKGLEGRAEAMNLVAILAALRNTSIDAVLQAHGGETFAPFKKELTTALQETLGPIRERYHHWMGHPNSLRDILQAGSAKAQRIASHNLEEIYDYVGFTF